MSENTVESSSFLTQTIGQISPPIVMNGSNQNVATGAAAFNATQNLSNQLNMNVIQQNGFEDYYEPATMNAYDSSFIHSQTLGNNTINQLVNQTPITDINQYPLVQDPNPEHIRRQNNNRITYQQDVAIRYLKPPTPPPPGPVIVREIRPPQPPDAPPLIIRRNAPVPPTPPPVVIRERPPMPPPIEPSRVVNKYLPAPPPPPRKVIIERQAPLPQKPQPVIIEKWLPYGPQPERRVIVEHAQPFIPKPLGRNIIITYDSPRVDVIKNIRDLGVIRADPLTYAQQYGAQLASNDYVLNTMTRFGIGNNYSQMMQMQQSMNNRFIGNQSMTYGGTFTSNLSPRQSQTISPSIENLLQGPILPDGTRKIHSEKEEIIRQTSVVN